MVKTDKDNRVDAFTLFPDLFSQETKRRRPEDTSFGEIELKPITRNSGKFVHPPLPPDVSWLENENIDLASDEPIDIPSALILVRDDMLRNDIISIVKKYGYLVESAETPLEGVHRLSYSDYGVVVMHTGFEDRISLSDSAVHNYLCKLPMSRRRGVYYIAIGPNLQTYYRLEALTLSVNMVVNERDVKHLGKILEKGFREYEDLFGPLMDVMHCKM